MDESPVNIGSDGEPITDNFISHTGLVQRKMLQDLGRDENLNYENYGAGVGLGAIYSYTMNLHLKVSPEKTNTQLLLTNFSRLY